MLSLIVAILFGLGITFFAFQNSILVPVNLTGAQLFNTPLYLVVVISLLLGIIMAWIISIADGFTHFMQIRGKENVIQSDKKVMEQLQERINKLETENARLLAGNKNVHIEKAQISSADREFYKPSLFEKLFPNSRKHYSKQV